MQRMFFKFLAEVQRGLSVRTTHTFRRGETPRKTRGPVRGLAQIDRLYAAHANYRCAVYLQLAATARSQRARAAGLDAIVQ